MKPLPEYTKTPAAHIADLVARAQGGDATARNQVIERNMRLVAKIAYKTARQFARLDLLDDLIQAGLVGTTNTHGGLVRAIELFDTARGIAFSTYASRWIRAGVMAFMLGALCQTVSHGQVRRNRMVVKAADALRRKLGREPTPDEIRGSLSVHAAEHMSAKAIAATGPIEIDGLPDDDELSDGATESDTIRQLDLQCAMADVRLAVNTLPPFWRDVVFRKLDGESFEAIGKSCGFSRERARQIYGQAIKRLRTKLQDDELMAAIA